MHDTILVVAASSLYLYVATFNITLETPYIRPVWYALFILRIFIDCQVYGFT